MADAMEQLVLRIERQHVCAIRRVMLRVSRSLERMAIRFWYTAVGLGRDQVARIGRLGAAHYWPSPAVGLGAAWCTASMALRLGLERAEPAGLRLSQLA